MRVSDMTEALGCILDAPDVGEVKVVRLATKAEAEIKQEINYRVLSDSKVELTKELAQEFIEMPAFIGERPLRDSHVDYLVDQAKSGAFIPTQGSISTCICGWDGQERRLNGQHTCWMRSYMPDNWPCRLQVIKYRVETENDFRKLYSSIDRGAPRTNGHIVNARLYGTSEFDGISKDVIKMLATGLRLWRFGDPGGTGERPTVDRIASTMQGEHLGISLKVAELIRLLGIAERHPGRTGDHMRRGAVIAAMFATSDKNHSSSIEFWRTVVDGISISSVTRPAVQTARIPAAARGGSRSRGCHGKGSSFHLRICSGAVYLHGTHGGGATKCFGYKLRARDPCQDRGRGGEYMLLTKGLAELRSLFPRRHYHDALVP